MLNVHTVMPSGAISRGYEFESEDDAIKAFDRIRTQISDMNFDHPILVVLDSDGEVFQWEAVNHVAK